LARKKKSPIGKKRGTRKGLKGGGNNWEREFHLEVLYEKKRGLMKINVEKKLTEREKQVVIQIKRGRGWKLKGRRLTKRGKGK